MGEGENDQQRIKRIAAAAYEYERDPRWAEYWSNVLMPPSLASRSDVVDHFKRKFYKRYIDPDLVVESIVSKSSSQSSRSSIRSESTARPEQGRSNNSGSYTGTSGTTHQGMNGSSMHWGRFSSQLSVCAMVISALLCLIPQVPIHIANRAYRLFFLHNACLSLYSLYTLYGVPRVQSLTATQSWFQSISATKDFLYFMYCLTFIPFSVNFKFALLPLLIQQVEHNSKLIRRNFGPSSLYRKLLEKTCLWVEANTSTIDSDCATAEIVMGFLLIVSLLSWQRSIIHPFMYWHLLKLMYHSPATAGYHQSAWARIDRTTNPYINSYFPFLRTPLLNIQRWWTT